MGTRLTSQRGVCSNDARERLVGGFNRIIGGILIHSLRRDASICEATRFPEIQNFCLGGYVSGPFGVDPVFKPATASFNPDMSEIDMLRGYNCTEDYGSDAVRGRPGPPHAVLGVRTGSTRAMLIASQV